MRHISIPTCLVSESPILEPILHSCPVGSHEIQPDTNFTIATASIIGIWSVSIGEIPVQLSTPTWGLSGILSQVGVDAERDERARNSFYWQIFQLDDVNLNNIYDSGEGLTLVNQVSIDPAVIISANASQSYLASPDVSSINGQILGADATYVVMSQNNIRLDYALPTGSELFVEDTIVESGFGQANNFEFTANPVPEPGTMAVLGIGLIPFIRRRKLKQKRFERFFRSSELGKSVDSAPEKIGIDSTLVHIVPEDEGI